MIMHNPGDDEFIGFRLRDDLFDLLFHCCWRANGGDGEHLVHACAFSLRAERGHFGDGDWLGQRAAFAGLHAEEALLQ